MRHIFIGGPLDGQARSVPGDPEIVAATPTTDRTSGPNDDTVTIVYYRRAGSDSYVAEES